MWALDTKPFKDITHIPENFLTPRRFPGEWPWLRTVPPARFVAVLTEPSPNRQYRSTKWRLIAQKVAHTCCREWIVDLLKTDCPECGKEGHWSILAFAQSPPNFAIAIVSRAELLLSCLNCRPINFEWQPALYTHEKCVKARSEFEKFCQWPCFRKLLVGAQVAINSSTNDTEYVVTLEL